MTRAQGLRAAQLDGMQKSVAVAINRLEDASETICCDMELLDRPETGFILDEINSAINRLEKLLKNARDFYDSMDILDSGFSTRAGSRWPKTSPRAALDALRERDEMDEDWE